MFDCCAQQLRAVDYNAMPSSSRRISWIPNLRKGYPSARTLDLLDAQGGVWRGECAFKRFPPPVHHLAALCEANPRPHLAVMFRRISSLFAAPLVTEPGLQHLQRRGCCCRAHWLLRSRVQGLSPSFACALALQGAVCMQCFLFARSTLTRNNDGLTAGARHRSPEQI